MQNTKQELKATEQSRQSHIKQMKTQRKIKGGEIHQMKK